MLANSGKSALRRMPTNKPWRNSNEYQQLMQRQCMNTMSPSGSAGAGSATIQAFNNGGSSATARFTPTPQSQNAFNTENLPQRLFIPSSMALAVAVKSCQIMMSPEVEAPIQERVVKAEKKEMMRKKSSYRGSLHIEDKGNISRNVALGNALSGRALRNKDNMMGVKPNPYDY